MPNHLRDFPQDSFLLHYPTSIGVETHVSIQLEAKL